MNESKNTSSISKASNLEEIAEFWETHSLDDYWEQTQEVEFEVRAIHKRRITLEPDIYAQIEASANKRGILPETLVNLWLFEKLQMG